VAEPFSQQLHPNVPKATVAMRFTPQDTATNYAEKNAAEWTCGSSDGPDRSNPLIRPCLVWGFRHLLAFKNRDFAKPRFLRLAAVQAKRSIR